MENIQEPHGDLYNCFQWFLLELKVTGLRRCGSGLLLHRLGIAQFQEAAFTQTAYL